MARSLYVPMHLDARLVQPGDQPVLPPVLHGPAFGASNSAPLAQGVHLHWALPDALTRGQVDTNINELCFPAVPDRWIVIRFASVATSVPTPGDIPAARAIKAFELDAKRPGPLQPIGSINFNDPGRGLEWLTALGQLMNGRTSGQGSVLAQKHLEAAYYSIATGRYGCHDNLVDLGTFDWLTLHLSYLVIGHYTNSNEDPLTRLGDDEARAEWLESAQLFVDLSERHMRQRQPLTSATANAARPINIGSMSIIDPDGYSRPVDSGYLADLVGVLGPEPAAKVTSTLNRITAIEEQTAYWASRFAAQLGASVLPAPVVLEDADGMPSRLVCHGAIVDLGPNGAYNSGPKSLTGNVNVADSVDAAIDQALLNIGGAEVLSLLRAGIDGDVVSSSGRQALGHLLHASSFDGAPEVPPIPIHDFTLVLMDPSQGSTPWTPPPNGTSVRIVDRRAIHDPNLPSGLLAEQLTAFVTTLAGTASVVLEKRLQSHPRWYRASSPVLQLNGYGRSYRHGHDGRMHKNGQLACRAGGQTVKVLELNVEGHSSTRTRFVGQDLVDLGAQLAKEPGFVRELVYEHALLDPTNAADVARRWLLGASSQSQDTATVAHKACLEATQGWWAAADPNLSTLPPAAKSFRGTLPVPLALTRWTDPWLPLFADIEYEFTSWCSSVQNLSLDPIDTGFSGVASPAIPAITIRTREVLSSAFARGLGAALYRIADDVTTTSIEAQKLRELASSLANMDTMTVGFGELDPALRTNQHAFRGGRLRVKELRLIDTFGAVRTVVQPTAPCDCTLTPRLTHWARVQARFTRAESPLPAVAPQLAAPDADAVHSPLAGFLIYDAVEHALEFFNPSGNSLGQLRHDRVTKNVHWEGSPSQTNVATITHPVLARVQQVLQTGPDPIGNASALSAALSVFSTARLSVGPRQTTDSHLSLLCGRPIVVLRARFELQVAGIGSSDQPVSNTPALAPDGIRIRLGSLDQIDDGLLGFFMLDSSNAWRMHVVPYYAQQTWKDPYIVTHSIISKDTSFILQPNVPREAILLLDGISAFHVQSGLLPRKRIHPGELVPARLMNNIMPTLRVGPVLFSETARRISTAQLPEKHWSFVESTAEANTFKVTQLSPFAPALAEIPDSPLRVGEGWLRLDVDR